MTNPESGPGVLSPFAYLLNAMETAAQQENPADHGYADRRRAVLEYVVKLESAACAEAARNCPKCGEPLK